MLNINVIILYFVLLFYVCFTLVVIINNINFNSIIGIILLLIIVGFPISNLFIIKYLMIFIIFNNIFILFILYNILSVLLFVLVINVDTDYMFYILLLFAFI